ncbi:MAG: hypothetical protein A4E53_00157 [Pelotomaculum sp. PtaB.Bin104]|nr:MAG: hypothetical protein A4E53_00157 [Pelotomaculum sp. PtaB.Bin104]
MANKTKVVTGKTNLSATKTKGKKMPGKANVLACVSVYKPTIYLDNKQIPKGIDSAQIGSKVQMVVTGKIISTSERQDRDGKNRSISIEIDKIKPKKGGK